MREGRDSPTARPVVIARSARRSNPDHLRGGTLDCFALLAMTRSATPRQPPHHLVELLEVAVADLHASAGIAVVDADSEPERIGNALFQRDGVGVLGLATAAGPRLLRLALRHALFMRERLGLADV